MKRCMVWLCITIVVTGVTYAQDAVDVAASSIIRSSRERIKAATTQTRSRMVLQAKNGGTTERVIDQYSKDDAAGNARKVIVFQSPASVKGTRFLTQGKKAGASDQWIYLPALGKVRRIASSEGGGSFMGTDMSYDDVASTERDTDADTHTLLREETYRGADCYVIQSVPKDKDYQYSKMVSWIDKDKSLLYKIELYDKKGAHVKTMESGRYEDVQGRLTAKEMKVSTLAAGTSTTITTEIINYDKKIPESVFTTQYLETGKAR